MSHSGNAKRGLAFIICFFLFQTISNSQSLREMTFIDYENVIAELKDSESSEELIYNYDYIAVLLLDSSKIDFLIQKGFNDIETFRNYALGLSQSNQALGFVTDIKSLKELFQDGKSLERILKCTQNDQSSDINMIKFDYPIYFKGNEAIFETSGPTWSDTYHTRLTNGILQIYWLGGMIH